MEQSRDSADERSPVVKALRLLAHLAQSEEPVALAELSRALKMPKPTLYRLARLIEAAGFVQKDPLTRRYRIGKAFEELSISALRNGIGHGPRRLRMHELAEMLGARVNLVVLKSGNLSFVEWVESTAPLRIDIGVGAPMPIHGSASGKLLLAFGPESLRRHVLNSAPYVAYTKRTITTARALERELAKIRRQGFAEDDQELLPGVNCLAVPVYNHVGQVIAGLAVMAPTSNLPLDALRGQMPAILDCAGAISAELGWRPGRPLAGATAVALAVPDAKARRRGRTRPAPPAVGRLTT